MIFLQVVFVLVNACVLLLSFPQFLTSLLVCSFALHNVGRKPFFFFFLSRFFASPDILLSEWWFWRRLQFL